MSPRRRKSAINQALGGCPGFANRVTNDSPIGRAGFQVNQWVSEVKSSIGDSLVTRLVTLFAREIRRAGGRASRNVAATLK